MALAGFLCALLCLNWRVILLLIGISLHLQNTIRRLRLMQFIPCWQEYGRDCHLLVSVWNVISCWLSPKMQSQARVLQNGDISKIMTVGKVLHFAQPFSDFDGFVVFTVLVQPCWFIILVGFNTLGSNICKLGEPICFSNCFNWRRFSMLWYWSSLFVDQKLGQAVSENLTWNLHPYHQSTFVCLLDTVTPFLRRGLSRWASLAWSRVMPVNVEFSTY